MICRRYFLYSAKQDPVLLSIGNFLYSVKQDPIVSVCHKTLSESIKYCDRKTRYMPPPLVFPGNFLETVCLIMYPLVVSGDFRMKFLQIR